MFSADPCFLSKKKWQALLLELTSPEAIVAGKYQGLTLQSARVYDAYFAHLARVPFIVHTGLYLREVLKQHTSQQQSGVIPTTISQELIGKAAALGKEAALLRTDFQSWFAAYESLEQVCSPVEVPSQDVDSIFPTAMHFPSGVWHGSLYMGYWTSLFIVQSALLICRGLTATTTATLPSPATPTAAGDGGSTRSGLGTSEEAVPNTMGYQEQTQEIDYAALAADNQRLLDLIFRSVETVGKGYMGPFRIGYAVRIAYEAADLPTQMYLLGVLARRESHYAAVGTSGYPAPGGGGGMG